MKKSPKKKTPKKAAKKKAVKKKVVKKPILDGKIEEVIDLIIAGSTYRAIAKKYKVALSTLYDYISLSEHSVRVREALQYSASTYADQAEEVLKSIKKMSNSIEMARARELAQHYRWKAGKRAPKKYGDKLDLTSDGEKLPAANLAHLSYEELRKLAGSDNTGGKKGACKA